MKYTAAIIGLGKIGMLYDQYLSEQDFVLSHARAIELHPDFCLLGAVDPDPDLRFTFINKYKVPAYVSVEELLANLIPDVIVIANPTDAHLDTINKILGICSPRALLCEKPLSNDPTSARNMVEACRRKKVPLFVNFIRRADPGTLEIKKRIDSGQICMPFKAIVWYSKGLLHNGSHFSDLLTFWFGPIHSSKLINRGQVLNENDAEPDIQLTFRNGVAIFYAVWEEKYSHFAVEIMTGNGRLRCEPGGVITWQNISSKPTLSGNKKLQNHVEIIASDMNRYQYHILDQLVLALNGLNHTLCTGINAVDTQSWLKDLINSNTTFEC